ncbi:NAD(+) synthase [Virgibacillus alimentarius]|uniref:NH(3)-dependent NAD(+) synthetase n=1 Tax=Virgibacillus alimentarius TaxID=698769 RepID=A0ABS4S6J9_9BACI|nr:NAD(+) synthase [Virgibacillus alimentarius]MBP2256625.1 NAD+ synthase [Virgibacillus alimentarius]
MEKIVEDIVKWLQKQAKLAKVNGLLVGVSGGLDSAVVAHLIKRAFPDESLGVILPLNSNPEGMKDAHNVLKSCDIKGLNIDLSKTHELLFSQIQEQLKQENDFKQENEQLADANLRARLRMSTLYTIATNYNYLVVGTDNASEWYTGYFTKYGDGGVDILPIVDFTKEEVRQMASILGVPKEIIHKNPSADLWEGQTDEDEMGITYDKIDAYLKGEKIPEADEEIIESMHKRTNHKRSLVSKYKRIDRTSLI